MTEDEVGELLGVADVVLPSKDPTAAVPRSVTYLYTTPRVTIDFDRDGRAVRIEKYTRHPDGTRTVHEVLTAR
jgi:hypothetical protein